MNYLAHYILDHRRGHACYNAGLLLPDILRPQDGGYRIEEGARSDIDDLAPALVAFHHGIRRHVQRDRQFHSSSFFIQESRAIRHQLNAFPDLARKRYLFFLAHIWLELSLDRWLIVHHPDYAHALYRDLARVPKMSWARLLHFHRHPSPEWAIARLRKFHKHAFLWRYRDPLALRNILESVAQRVGLTFFEHLSEEAFLRLNHQIDTRMAQWLGSTTNRGPNLSALR